MLTQAQLAALKAELTAVDAQGAPLYPGLPASTGAALAALNGQGTTLVKPRMVTARTVLAEIDGGSLALDALEAFAAAPAPAGAEALHSAVRWAMKFLISEGGLDIGHARSQAMLDALVTAGVLSAAQASALKALAVQPASRAEVLLGAGVSVSEQDIFAALAA